MSIADANTLGQGMLLLLVANRTLRQQMKSDQDKAPAVPTRPRLSHSSASVPRPVLAGEAPSAFSQASSGDRSLSQNNVIPPVQQMPSPPIRRRPVPHQVITSEYMLGSHPQRPASLSAPSSSIRISDEDDRQRNFGPVVILFPNGVDRNDSQPESGSDYEFDDRTTLTGITQRSRATSAARQTLPHWSINEAYDWVLQDSQAKKKKTKKAEPMKHEQELDQLNNRGFVSSVLPLHCLY